MGSISESCARAQSRSRGELEARANARSTLGHGLIALPVVALVTVLAGLFTGQSFNGAVLVASGVTVSTMAVSSYLDRVYVGPYRRVSRMLAATDSAQAVEKP